MTLRVVPSTAPDLDWRWAEVLTGQESGGDPLGPWRAALTRSTERQQGRPVPPSMPSAFVLQWCLQAAADAGVRAALEQRLVFDPAGGSLSFALHPAQLYPIDLQLRVADHAARLADPHDALDAAHLAYLAAGTRLALGYPCEARLGEHQRRAMVADVWAMSLAATRGEPPPRRDSCCFIYVLPGVHECSGCPRLRRTDA